LAPRFVDVTRDGASRTRHTLDAGMVQDCVHRFLAAVHQVHHPFGTGVVEQLEDPVLRQRTCSLA